MVIQILLFPVFAALQLFMLLLPLWIISIFYFPDASGTSSLVVIQPKYL